ncbi:hypothetical protein PR002_g18043 [Phytophthora rubi]|uniref:Uncharacterized protein n=1 Tax=Phytophthora rubi TaxID=129364 RepID=A0A6A3K0A2_9STRA|nr:hypothetical protein PR002_g18043 [Phytophthora rubi]
MSRKVYVKMLKEKVFPAIREKLPGRKDRVIRVQQDNAGPHVEEDHVIQCIVISAYTYELSRFTTRTFTSARTDTQAAKPTLKLRGRVMDRVSKTSRPISMLMSRLKKVAKIL